MPDDNAPTDGGAPDTGGTPDPTGVPDATDYKAEAEKWQALARKHEDRAKANSSAAKELEELRKASMSEVERAVAEAKAAGRAEAIAEVGTQLVDAELRAAAAGRLADAQLDVLLQGLNRAAFLGADGTVDRASVVKFVNGIAPAAKEENSTSTGNPFDFGQGARGGDRNEMPLNGDPILAAVNSKLGIR